LSGVAEDLIDVKLGESSALIDEVIDMIIKFQIHRVYHALSQLE